MCPVLSKCAGCMKQIMAIHNVVILANRGILVSIFLSEAFFARGRCNGPCCVVSEARFVVELMIYYHFFD